MISLLGTISKLRQAKPIEPKTIEVAGRVLPLIIKRNARCRRMVLRLTPDGAGIALTLPLRLSLAEAMHFVETSKPWIATHLAKRAPSVAFQDGASVLLEGKVHALKAAGGRRGLVNHDFALLEIQVPGELAHISRRLTDWLKSRAKEKLTQASKAYATAMQTKYSKITIRDQKSRWGSCSANGELSYSWRLILAPPEVLDYVAAHEVAHLLEMNHGPRFWRLVLSHCKNAKLARNWLRHHGRELHRYG